MANPQPTDAHLRISHAITRELIRRNFSKPHKNILEFVLRLSWGCGSPSAYIPNRKDFAVCGVAVGHIADELKQLVEAKVLIVEEPFYQIQKDFDQWQVTPVKGWDSERFDDLVSSNIKRKNPDLRENIPNEGINSPSTGEHPVSREGSTSRPTGAEQPKIPYRARLRGASITKVLYSKKNIRLLLQQRRRAREEKQEIGNLFKTFEQEFGRPLGPMERDEINYWLDEKKHTPSLILRGLKEAVLAQARSFKYIDRCLSDWCLKGWTIAEQVDAGKRGQEQSSPPNQQPYRPPNSGAKVVGISDYSQNMRDKFNRHMK